MSVRIYTNAILEEMRRLAETNVESRDAFEDLKKRGILPEGQTLVLFRAKCSEQRIVWGGKKRNIDYTLEREYHDRLWNAANDRKTTVARLTRQLMVKIIDDNLFDAVLDDKA